MRSRTNSRSGPGAAVGEGLLEGVDRRARDPAGVGGRELDAPVGVHRSADARDERRVAFGPVQRQIAVDERAVGAARVLDQVDERQRALALVEVAVDLLAVLLLGAEEVEQVVLDLERRAEVEAEAHERPQVSRAADQRPGAQRVHGRVPARLVHDQVEVVLGLQRGHAVVAPAELGGLALERAQGHRVELRQHPVAEVLAEPPGMAAQHAVGQHGQSVARVQRQPQSVLGDQRRAPAAALGAVDDVVVDEEGVVQQLDRHGDGQRVAVVAAEGAARGHAQRGADALAGPARVRPRDAIEPAVRLAVRDDVEHRTADEPPDVLAVLLDAQVTVTCSGSHRSGAPSACSTPR